MRYTVYVRNYQFNPPNQITESEYNYYKQLIKSDPKAKLNATLPENPLKKGLRIAAKIGLAPLYMFAPGAAEGDIKSAINKSRAKREEDEFYQELKKMVIESNSFGEFCRLVKNRFKYYQ
jgi:hypothetical protein